MKKDLLALFGVLLIIIVFGVFLFASPKAPEVSYRPIDVGGGSIDVADQDQVEFVTLNAELAAPGFITIHETISDAPAEIIGISEYLEEGAYEDLVIPLSQDMLPGFRYAALLHADNGDRVYVTDADLPVMTDGEVVRPYFVAIPEAVRTDLPEE